MRRRATQRMLAAVLFTDIVDSTPVASRVGDARWKELIARHHAAVRKELKRFGGRELDTAGDGFFASFAEPAAAIRCACAAADAVRAFGIEIRAGVHFGECEQVGGKLGGLTVVVGARVMSLGGAGDVLVTATTSELVGGAGFGFAERGEHTLKGLDGTWRVRAVTDIDGSPRTEPADPDEANRRLEAIEPDTTRGRSTVRWTVAAALVAVALVAVVIPRIGSRGGPIQISANSAARLDPGGEQLDHSTPLEDRPGASAIGFGSVWVALPDRGQLARVDLDGGSIEEWIEVGGTPSGVAVDEDAVWITDASGGRLNRIDPQTNLIRDTFHAGTAPIAVSTGGGSLWVADSLGAQLLRIDPSTGETTSIRLPGEPSGVTYAPDGVWVTFTPAGIARVEPTTGNVTLTLNVGNGPTAVTSAFGSIWVANHLDGTVSRLDPTTGTERAKVEVGEGPNALAESGELMWVANELGDSIVAVDPATNEIARTTFIGSTAASLAADDDGLWLAAGASSKEHLGGTLTMNALDRPATLDPALADDSLTQQILSVTNDGLVAYKKVGGPSGLTLVPDLATALPQVSDEGRTYRFTLRDDVRYSTGEALRGEDVLRSIERAVSLNGYAADLFDAIDGVAGCRQGPASCDLSDAIEVDGSDVTISLTRPDPDLLYKLALPMGIVVPATTPIEEVSQVPATGPYMIEQSDGTAIELVRNPGFEVVEGAAAAQPGGFVDRISIRFGLDVDTSFDQVLAGDVDLMTDAPDLDDVEALLAQRPDQALVTLRPSTFFVGFDARQEPFDDPRVRRAVNVAIDRQHVVDLLGGPQAMRITCQILPPSLQGYEPFCPYGPGSASGVWKGADLDRGRALIAEAGAPGAKVMVLSPPDALRPGVIDVARYLTDLLNRLGLRPTLKVEHDDVAYYETIGSVRAVGHPHVFFSDWVSGFPRASDFIEPQFRCGWESNFAGYCDRALEVEMDEVKALEATEPGAAIHGWTEIEHRLVEDAVQAPLGNSVVIYPVSDRIGNVQVHPQLGVLMSRLWVL